MRRLGGEGRVVLGKRCAGRSIYVVEVGAAFP